jgi:hypothetical protein
MTREDSILAGKGLRVHRTLDDVGVCALPRCTVLPGENPGRLTLAPAGSTRGGSGGDEWSEALRETTSSGGQRTARAVTRVNTERQPQPPLGDAVNEIGIDRRHTKLRLQV